MACGISSHHCSSFTVCGLGISSASDIIIKSPLEIPEPRSNPVIALRCSNSSPKGLSYVPRVAIQPENTPWTIFSFAKANLNRFESKKRGLGMPVKVVFDSRITNLVM
jgi:hypothetical protein